MQPVYQAIPEKLIEVDKLQTFKGAEGTNIYSVRRKAIPDDSEKRRPCEVAMKTP